MISSNKELEIIKEFLHNLRYDKIEQIIIEEKNKYSFSETTRALENLYLEIEEILEEQEL